MIESNDQTPITTPGIRRDKGAGKLVPDPDSVIPAGCQGSNTELIQIGASGAIRTGPTGVRPRPVTHGKTLSYLIQSLADQIEESLFTEHQAIVNESARRERLTAQKAALERIMSEWQEAIKNLPQT